MNRRSFLKMSFSAAFASQIVGGCKSLSRFAKPASKPDIVVIMADDLGFSDLGCYGGEINTPNLDKLANDGLRLTQFYNAARCCPSRASLLTGLYPHQAGIGHMTEDKGFESYSGTLSSNAVTLPEMLKTGGYKTFMVGKWHVALNPLTKDDFKNWPLQRGFDKFFGTLAGYGSLYQPAGLIEDNEFINPSKDFFYTDAMADKAVEYIESISKTDTPMFLYFANVAPHYPLHAREKTIAKYKGVYDKGWDEVCKQRLKNLRDLGLIPKDMPAQLEDEATTPWDKAEHKQWQAQRMQTYAAMVEEMDAAIGRVVDALKRSGRFENTLILFFSDNGASCEGHLNNTIERTGEPWRSSFAPKTTSDGKPVIQGDIPGVPLGGADTFGSYGLNWASVSNTPFRRHKIWLHEGGISTPFIAHWSSRIKEKGKIRDDTAHITDLMPTFAELANVEYPSKFNDNQIMPYEGQSMASIFDAKKRSRDPIFWEHEGNRAVRDGKWKLVSEYPGKWRSFYPSQSGKWELYDISTDRGELNDLSKKHPERVDKMKKMYEKWAARVGVVDWEKIS